jgi:glycosyltransferase involved in cell wall biosynthesis
VGATKPIARDLRDRLHTDATWVSNGWDAETASATETLPPLPPGTLVYTGRLSGSWGRSPEALFRALARLRGKTDRPIRLVHAGPLSTADRLLIDRLAVGDLVEHLGVLDRPSSLAVQRSADVLVLITSRNSSEATGKIFEYFGAGRPILALAADSEAARLVAETNTGLAVAPDDVDAIADALQLIATGEMGRRYAPRDLERFIYPRPAELIAELVERAIWRRSGGAGLRTPSI